MDKKILKILLFSIICILGIGKMFLENSKKASNNVTSNFVSSQTSTTNTVEEKAKKTENKKKSEKTTGNRKYNIDYDHIIGGDENSSGKVTGGHTLLRGDVKIVKRIGKPASTGVYKATVQIRKKDGTWQTKTSNGGVNTMFPENWDKARVIDEINSAWENRKDLRGRDSNMWQGKSKSGVIIRGYKSPRITAYPIMEGER